MSIKAIDTWYKKAYFRSKLEARWAVFFETMGAEWEYEKKGYKLPNGQNYLPDFWLPGAGVDGAFVEIKPVFPSHEEKEKIRLLAKYSGKDSFIVYGLPGDHAPLSYTIVRTRENGELHTVCEDDGYELIEDIWPFDATYLQIPGAPRLYAGKINNEQFRLWSKKCKLLEEKSIEAARYARFEHGVKGYV